MDLFQYLILFTKYISCNICCVSYKHTFFFIANTISNINLSKFSFIYPCIRWGTIDVNFVAGWICYISYTCWCWSSQTGFTGKLMLCTIFQAQLKTVFRMWNLEKCVSWLFRFCQHTFCALFFSSFSNHDSKFIKNCRIEANKSLYSWVTSYDFDQLKRKKKNTESLLSRKQAN